MASQILVVDDDPVQRRLLKSALERAGHAVELLADGPSALARVKAGYGVDAIVLDLVMPGMDGLEVMRQLNEAGIAAPVIVQTSQGGIETVVKAMRAGAFDFVVKPVSPERLQSSVANALKAARSHPPKAPVPGSGFNAIVAASPSMDRVIALARRAAASDIPVVLEGESGVGKEMIARAIQVESQRRSKPFVTVNCGAIPANLVESILFGHEKGAFTGAADKHTGKFVEADHGTLFLDEIGDLPLDVQVKLLRAVQLGEIETVGARMPQKVDIRLISATNKDLIEEVKGGRFREDLYYRLNVFPIHIPALRKRKEDIPELVRHFALRFAPAAGRRQPPAVTPEAMALLTAHDWPGNIRELENAVHRAIVLCDGYALTPDLFPQIAAQLPGYDLLTARYDDIPSETVFAPNIRVEPVPASERVFAEIGLPLFAGSASASTVTAVTAHGDVRPLAEMEEELIRFAISHYHGQMSEVARRLGIGRSTLYRKIKDYAIDPDDPERRAA